MKFNLYNISILILSIIYVIVNFVYKKPENIVIFTSLILLISYFSEKFIESIVIAYIISILYGIFKNFHLLENFKQHEYSIKYDNNLQKIKHNKKKKINTKEKNNKFDIEETKNMIMTLLDTNLLSNFINSLRKKNTKITKQKIDINSLKPIKNKLDNIKINSMREKINNDIIIVSKDLFIIDGHHRWFSKQSLLNQNLSYNVKINKNIDIEVIDLDIKTFVKQLMDYKRAYNKEQLNQLSFDKTKLNQAKILINNIKNDINKLDTYYQDLNNIKLL